MYIGSSQLVNPLLREGKYVKAFMTTTMKSERTYFRFIIIMMEMYQ